MARLSGQKIGCVILEKLIVVVLLCRKRIEKILDLAGCKILSEIKNENMTAYLLRYEMLTTILFICKNY